MDISDESKNKIRLDKENTTKHRQLRTSIKRRALVKGSAAVLPAIFTLRSGAVLAQVAGESLTCADKIATQVNTDGQVQTIVSVDDQLVRTSALQRELSVVDSVGTVIRMVSIFIRSLDDQSGPWVTEDGTEEWQEDPTTPGQMQRALTGETGTFAVGTDTPVFILACPNDGTGTPPLFCAAPEVTTPSCMASLVLSGG